MAAGNDRYQRVFVKVWASESFTSLTERARLLFLYLLTCPQTSLLSGVVVVNLGSVRIARAATT